jgi:hypothetical protein
MRLMGHAAYTQEIKMHIFSSENMRGRDYLEDTGVNEKILKLVRMK